jgi:hypothetical protein
MRSSASSNRIINSPTLARASVSSRSSGSPRIRSPRVLLQEHPLPALELVRGHLAFARDRIERLAAQEPQY